ncbi:MAG: SufE family protein [Opitutaceae bacterium]|nr:SufE family protein [Verrucomicrobiales bacterium]
MTVNEKQARLTEALLPLRDTNQRLAWLVEQARQRPPMPAEVRIDANRVEGCLARLWFTAELREGRCNFQSDSDSLVVKSVAGLLCEFYSGLTPDKILQHDPAFLAGLGINQHLTRNRRNALSSVWERIRSFAEGQGTDQTRPALS